MQSPDSDNSQATDEGSINFRPSPNFKHMKKYLKSKFEEDMNASNMSLDPKDFDKDEEKSKDNTAQPPLPPHSPPGGLMELALTLKKEILDDEYEMTNGHDISDESSVSSGPTHGASTDGDIAKKPTMCKDFVRKTCKRGASCIYAHELDIDQLKGVYRFCRDFENDRCERKICYFVHATTFEKEHFFRSGELPDHALAHIQPSTPQAQSGSDVKPESSPVLSCHSVAAQPVHPVPLSGCVPAAAMAGDMQLVDPAAGDLGITADPMAGSNPDSPPPPASLVLTVSLKREWIGDCLLSSDDCSAEEPPAKVCITCEAEPKCMSIREQQVNLRMEQELQELGELCRKIERETERGKRLQAAARALFQSPLSQTSLTGLPAELVQEYMRRRITPALSGNMLLSQRDTLLAQVKLMLAQLILTGREDFLNGWDFTKLG